jgi:uridine kinase
MSLANAVRHIAERRRALHSGRALLVAVSGIDGAGKGWLADRLGTALEAEGFSVAVIHGDGWLNLPPVRFGSSDPALHFYRHAFRFEDLFSRLLLPLRDHRSIRLEADFTDETAYQYRKHHWCFANVDVILVECIFLLKRELRGHYDLSIWIDCSFETALHRALDRAQEALPPEETVSAYRTIYFPAQEIHMACDAPRDAATLIVPNDARLGFMVA